MFSQESQKNATFRFAPLHFLGFRIGSFSSSYDTSLSLTSTFRVVDELADSASEVAGKGKGKGASDEARERVEAEAKEGRELLGEVLRTVAALLASGPVHREEFLQVCALGKE